MYDTRSHLRPFIFLRSNSVELGLFQKALYYMYIFFKSQSECTKAGGSRHMTLTQRVRGFGEKKKEREKEVTKKGDLGHFLFTCNSL